ncbi:MAG: polysaccharide biosynthesis protein [Bacilli bacterium]|nr:polysaccharide biosynthesis protein [Bacilli bacterium]
MTKRRVMFISSTGGHLHELLQLKKMFKNYEYSLITEKTKSNLYLKEEYGKRVKFLIYGTKHHILTYPFKLLANCFISLYYYLKFRPDYIITTGVHTAGPMCCIGKIFGSKIIYIETFANMVTKTATGRLVYPISDKFIVQWESMKNLYPKADFGGWIF